eukprot:sb/3460769/
MSKSDLLEVHYKFGMYSEPPKSPQPEPPEQQPQQQQSKSSSSSSSSSSGKTRKSAAGFGFKNKKKNKKKPKKRSEPPPMERISEERSENQEVEEDYVVVNAEEEEDFIESDHEYKIEFTGVKFAVDTTELNRNVTAKKRDVFGDKNNPKSFQAGLSVKFREKTDQDVVEENIRRALEEEEARRREERDRAVREQQYKEVLRLKDKTNEWVPPESEAGYNGDEDGGQETDDGSRPRVNQNANGNCLDSLCLYVKLQLLQFSHFSVRTVSPDLEKHEAARKKEEEERLVREAEEARIREEEEEAFRREQLRREAEMQENSRPPVRRKKSKRRSKNSKKRKNSGSGITFGFSNKKKSTASSSSSSSSSSKAPSLAPSLPSERAPSEKPPSTISSATTSTSQNIIEEFWTTTKDAYGVQKAGAEALIDKTKDFTKPVTDKFDKGAEEAKDKTVETYDEATENKRSEPPPMERISEERSENPEVEEDYVVVNAEEEEDFIESDHEYKIEFTGVKFAVDTTELNRNVAAKKRDVFGDKNNPKSFQAGLSVKFREKTDQDVVEENIRRALEEEEERRKEERDRAVREQQYKEVLRLKDKTNEWVPPESETGYNGDENGGQETDSRDGRSRVNQNANGNCLDSLCLYVKLQLLQFSHFSVRTVSPDLEKHEAARKKEEEERLAREAEEARVREEEEEAFRREQVRREAEMQESKRPPVRRKKSKRRSKNSKKRNNSGSGITFGFSNKKKSTASSSSSFSSSRKSPSLAPSLPSERAPSEKPPSTISSATTSTSQNIIEEFWTTTKDAYEVQKAGAEALIDKTKDFTKPVTDNLIEYLDDQNKDQRRMDQKSRIKKLLSAGMETDRVLLVNLLHQVRHHQIIQNIPRLSRWNARNVPRVWAALHGHPGLPQNQEKFLLRGEPEPSPPPPPPKSISSSSSSSSSRSSRKMESIPEMEVLEIVREEDPPTPSAPPAESVKSHSTHSHSSKSSHSSKKSSGPNILTEFFVTTREAFETTKVGTEKLIDKSNEYKNQIYENIKPAEEQRPDPTAEDRSSVSSDDRKSQDHYVNIQPTQDHYNARSKQGTQQHGDGSGDESDDAHLQRLWRTLTGQDDDEDKEKDKEERRSEVFDKFERLPSSQSGKKDKKKDRDDKKKIHRYPTTSTSQNIIEEFWTTTKDAYGVQKAGAEALIDKTKDFTKPVTDKFDKGAEEAKDKTVETYDEATENVTVFDRVFGRPKQGSEKDGSEVTNQEAPISRDGDRSSVAGKSSSSSSSSSNHSKHSKIVSLERQKRSKSLGGSSRTSRTSSKSGKSTKSKLQFGFGFKKEKEKKKKKKEQMKPEPIKEESPEPDPSPPPPPPPKSISSSSSSSSSRSSRKMESIPEMEVLEIVREEDPPATPSAPPAESVKSHSTHSHSSKSSHSSKKSGPNIMTEFFVTTREAFETTKVGAEKIIDKSNEYKNQIYDNIKPTEEQRPDPSTAEDRSSVSSDDRKSQDNYVNIQPPPQQNYRDGSGDESDDAHLQRLWRTLTGQDDEDKEKDQEERRSEVFDKFERLPSSEEEKKKGKKKKGKTDTSDRYSVSETIYENLASGQHIVPASSSSSSSSSTTTTSSVTGWLQDASVLGLLIFVSHSSYLIGVTWPGGD